jgi:hypothetical protein
MEGKGEDMQSIGDREVHEVTVRLKFEIGCCSTDEVRSRWCADLNNRLIGLRIQPRWGVSTKQTEKKEDVTIEERENMKLPYVATSCLDS